MKRAFKKNILLFHLVVLLLPACMNEPIMQPNTHEGNFEALWRIIDTRYCFLDYKNINWDSIHDVYKTRLATDTTEFEFFDLLGDMLAELQDGHVNLSSYFDRSRYWNWFTDYPSNFSGSLISSSRYLGKDYRVAGGFRYQKIADDSIGYIYYGSFSDGFSDTNMRYIMNYFIDCKGLIIDVRDNGGGDLESSEALASYFFKNDTITGYIRHKTGNGHSDFSTPQEIVTKANKKIQWERPLIVLSNRLSYSATNDFVNRIKSAPNALVIGDQTGGGGGLPFSSELPNGWSIRFSASPMFDRNMQHTEWGIQPDIPVALDSADVARGYDTIIEEAIKIISQSHTN